MIICPRSTNCFSNRSEHYSLLPLWSQKSKGAEVPSEGDIKDKGKAKDKGKGSDDAPPKPAAKKPKVKENQVQGEVIDVDMEKPKRKGNNPPKRKATSEATAA